MSTSAQSNTANTGSSANGETGTANNGNPNHVSSNGNTASTTATTSELERIKDLVGKGLIDDDEAKLLRGVALGLPPPVHAPETKQEEGDTAEKLAGPASALQRYFEVQEQRKLDPWRYRESQMLAERNSIMAESDATLQSATIEMAKAAQFGPDEVLALSYLQYGNAEARKYFVGLLQRKSGLQRMTAHNFYVASQAEPAFLDMWGAVLLYCPYPLFPAVEGFHNLNRMMLTAVRDSYEAGANVHGGGDRVIPQPAVYKRANKVTGGEYWAAVHTNAEGKQAVNLSEIESAHLAHARDLSILKKEIANMKKQANRGRGDQQQGERTGYPSSYNNPNAYTNYNTTYNGREVGRMGSGRGGIRGRRSGGRGSGGNPRGGADLDENFGPEPASTEPAQDLGQRQFPPRF